MKKSAQQQAIDIAAVQSRMLTIRNQQVLLDRDVAALYGVETKALNQAVKRNAERFEDGYLFQLDAREVENWKPQIVTSNLPEREIASLKMGVRHVRSSGGDATAVYSAARIDRRTYNSIGCSTMVVHRTVNATVAGSSPATRAKYGHGIKAVPWTPNPDMSVRIRLSVPISSGVVSQKGSELSPHKFSEIFRWTASVILWYHTRVPRN